MKRGLPLLVAHELALAGATTLAILAAWLSGELAFYFTAVLFVPAVAAWLHLRGRPAPVVVATLIAFMALAWGLMSFWQGGLERWRKYSGL